MVTQYRCAKGVESPISVDAGQRNLAWASALVDGLVATGVRHFVLSPGSRSTPLVLACQQHDHVKTWILPDERSAAFFALGVGKALNAPVGVISTSGSAPANWYSAVVEASQDMRPLILISADRPTDLQACGANQAVDQTRLFGVHVRGFYGLSEADDASQALHYVRDTAARAVDLSRWPVPGPVHINIPLREPLVPSQYVPASLKGAGGAMAIAYPRLTPAAADVVDLVARISGKRGIIVCGRGDFPSDFATAVIELAARLACPILADPLSGLRCGPHDRTMILTHYDAFLRNSAFVGDHRPDWVLQFGAAPTSRSLQQYLETSDEDGFALIVPCGPWPEPSHRSRRIVHADPGLLCQALLETEMAQTPGEWSGSFRTHERRTAQGLNRNTKLPLEAQVIALLQRHCPAGTLLFCGNSMVIRDVDTFLCGREEPLYLIGNRGVSGIDGNLSTALGMAAVGQASVVGLLGDLALYHDMNGLLAARHSDATLVVFNNGGGAIFEYLPQASLPDFERYWLTPTNLDPVHIAALYGLRHHRVEQAAAFESALHESLSTQGVGLIEVVIDRAQSVERHRAYWKSVASDQ